MFCEEFNLENEKGKFKSDWGQCIKSKFDEILENNWNKKMEAGYFRYKLESIKSKILPGKNKFFAQLNVERSTNRRPPAEINCLQQPFNPEVFNFTKMNKEEILLKLNSSRQKSDELQADYVAINISPLEHCHSLLLPSLFACLPQIVTKNSLERVVRILLISNSPAIRIGFNGLCAYATVNHLHYHIYYLKQQMLLEYINVEPLTDHCYQLLDYPGKGFVFQIRSEEEINFVLRKVHSLTTFLLENNIAHNLYFTRGTSFGTFQKCAPEERDCIRIYIWARTSSTGAKELDAFNPALCELFGHLVIKTEDAFNTLTDESVSLILENITHPIFFEIREQVRKLLETHP